MLGAFITASPSTQDDRPEERSDEKPNTEHSSQNEQDDMQNAGAGMGFYDVDWSEGRSHSYSPLPGPDVLPIARRGAPPRSFTIDSTGAQVVEVASPVRPRIHPPPPVRRKTAW